ncbi:MAG: M23 family metallopeptidase [Bauldia sp.]|nr:M23 family metallopeptidase [Bauldia sp.]
MIACAILFAHANPVGAQETPAVASGGTLIAANALFIMPVSGARLSSGFGEREHPILGGPRMHEGIDWAAPSGTPIVAVAQGVVVSAGWESGYGYTTRIMHAGNVETVYAHQSSIVSGLDAGDFVEQGEMIGAVGSTGRSTGPHLHFEILVDGRPVDPLGTDLQQLDQRFQVARAR